MRHDLHNRLHTCNRSTKQYLISVIKPSDQIIIIRICNGIMVSTDNILSLRKLAFAVFVTDAVHQTAHSFHHLALVIDRSIQLAIIRIHDHHNGILWVLDLSKQIAI